MCKKCGTIINLDTHNLGSETITINIPRGCINPINLNNTVEYRCTLIRKNTSVYTFISDSIWTLQKHYRQ